MALFDNLLNSRLLAVDNVALVIKNKTQANSRLRWCVNFKELAVSELVLSLKTKNTKTICIFRFHLTIRYNCVRRADLYCVWISRNLRLVDQVALSCHLFPLLLSLTFISVVLNIFPVLKDVFILFPVAMKVDRSCDQEMWIGLWLLFRYFLQLKVCL